MQMVILLVCLCILVSFFVIGHLSETINDKGSILKVDQKYPTVVPIFQSQLASVEALIDSKTLTLDKLCALLKRDPVTEPFLFCLPPLSGLCRRLSLYSIPSVPSGPSYVIAFISLWIGPTSIVLSNSDDELFCSPELAPLWRNGTAKVDTITEADVGELSSNITLRPNDPIVIVSSFTKRAPRPLGIDDAWSVSALRLSTLHVLSKGEIIIQSILNCLSDRPILVVNVPDVYME
jgi:hypothetical protein